MNLGILNRVCFAICVCAISAGVILGLLMIWTPGINEILWRLFATIGVVFLGAFATLSVSRTYGGSASDGGDKGGDA